MAWFLTRLVPWGAAANIAVQLAKLGLEHKAERDRLRATSRAKDVEVLEARLTEMAARFNTQIHLMEELARGLEQELGRMRRAVLTAYGVAATGAFVAIVALLVAIL
jgi:hypothetical protein